MSQELVFGRTIEQRFVVSLVFLQLELTNEGTSQIFLRIRLTIQIEGHLVDQVGTIISVSFRVPLLLGLEMTHELVQFLVEDTNF